MHIWEGLWFQEILGHGTHGHWNCRAHSPFCVDIIGHLYRTEHQKPKDLSARVQRHSVIGWTRDRNFEENGKNACKFSFRYHYLTTRDVIFSAFPLLGDAQNGVGWIWGHSRLLFFMRAQETQGRCADTWVQRMSVLEMRGTTDMKFIPKDELKEIQFSRQLSKLSCKKSESLALGGLFIWEPSFSSHHLGELFSFEGPLCLSTPGETLRVFPQRPKPRVSGIRSPKNALAQIRNRNLFNLKLSIFNLPGKP